MTDFGSSEAGKKGGKARADSLTREERREIARKAALVRWGSSVPQATYEGSFPIGNATVFAAVLTDGVRVTRVLTQATFMRAIGRARSPKAGTGVLSTVDGTPFFLQAEILKPFITKELLESTRPIFFKDKNGANAVGYNAEALPDVAEVYLKMRDASAKAGKPVPRQYEHIVTSCDIVMRALARVAIVALVDEATGYQRDRARDELAKILEAFVAKEIQKWLKTFDPEFYELICELRGEPLERAKKRPAYFGKLTNNLVYQRLAPGVLQKLQEVNPVTEKGRRKHAHHQHLTPDLGHPKLKEHLSGIISAMKFAKHLGMQWEAFLNALDKTYPKYHPMPLFDQIQEEE